MSRVEGTGTPGRLSLSARLPVKPQLLRRRESSTEETLVKRKIERFLRCDFRHFLDGNADIPVLDAAFGSRLPIVGAVFVWGGLLHRRRRGSRGQLLSLGRRVEVGP